MPKKEVKTLKKSVFARARDFFRRGLYPGGHPSEAEIVRILTGASLTGHTVDEEKAMRFSAVYSCVRVLSESVAQLPLKIYRRKGDGRQEAADHYLYPLLHSAPNPRQTAFSFWEAVTASLALWGNAYALIDLDNAGRVAALWFLDPSTVMPRKDIATGKLVYDVKLTDGTNKTLMWDELFHIPGLGFDGLRGHSVVKVVAEAIGQGIAASEYAGRFFDNDATPRGVLETDAFFKDPSAVERLRKSWNDLYQGTDNAHRVAILENGLKFKPLTINPEDAQLLETRKFNRSEIAGIFRVPLHMIGDLDKATFSNIEHQSIDFVKFSLSPWLKRIEQAISLQLFSPGERKRYFAEFKPEGMLKGDVKSRYEAYEVAIRSGWMSINEVRGLENLNPVEGGDEHYLQMQMIPISQAGKEAEYGQQGNTSDPGGVPDTTGGE